MAETSTTVATKNFDEAQRVAANVRRRTLELAEKNGGGYLIQACSSADILAVLYLHLMNLGDSVGPAIPETFPGVPKIGRKLVWGGDYHGAADANKDRFIMSPSHYATAVYGTLIEVGRLAEDALSHYGVDGSTLEMIGAEHSPGNEVTGGSLAQALSVGVGQALARKRSGRPGHIWVFISDGETQEGQTWEAVQAAVAFGLDNLTVLVDNNGWQVDGPMASVMPISSLRDRAAAFGADAVDVDGHDMPGIVAACTRSRDGRPRVVVCRTEPTTGFPALKDRDDAMTHFVRFRPGEADDVRAKSDLYTKATA